MFLLLSLIVNFFMFGSVTPAMKKAGVLDMAGFYSVDTAYRMLEEQGNDGRQRYLLINSTLDIIYPVFYTSFYLIWVALTWGGILSKKNKYINLVYFFPIAAFCSDYLENAGVIAMILKYPVRLEGIALATSIASAAKWIIFIILNILQLVGTGLKLVKKTG